MHTSEKVIRTIEAARKLIQHVSDKHHIQSYEDFTCPHMRELAEAVDLFSNTDPETII